MATGPNRREETGTAEDGRSARAARAAPASPADQRPEPQTASTRGWWRTNSEMERRGAPGADGKGRAPRSLARSAGRELCEQEELREPGGTKPGEGGRRPLPAPAVRERFLPPRSRVALPRMCPKSKPVGIQPLSPMFNRGAPPTSSGMVLPSPCAGQRFRDSSVFADSATILKHFPPFCDPTREPVVIGCQYALPAKPIVPALLPQRHPIFK